MLHFDDVRNNSRISLFLHAKSISKTRRKMKIVIFYCPFDNNFSACWVTSFVMSGTEDQRLDRHREGGGVRERVAYVDIVKVLQLKTIQCNDRTDHSQLLLQNRTYVL